jgi:hypothetical protein
MAQWLRSPFGFTSRRTRLVLALLGGIAFTKDHFLRIEAIPGWLNVVVLACALFAAWEVMGLAVAWADAHWTPRVEQEGDIRSFYEPKSGSGADGSGRQGH